MNVEDNLKAIGLMALPIFNEVALSINKNRYNFHYDDISSYKEALNQINSPLNCPMADTETIKHVDIGLRDVIIGCDRTKLEPLIEKYRPTSLTKEGAIVKATFELIRNDEAVVMFQSDYIKKEYGWGGNPLEDIPDLREKLGKKLQEHRFQFSGTIKGRFDNFKDRYDFLYPCHSEITYLGKYLVEEINFKRN